MGFDKLLHHISYCSEMLAYVVTILFYVRHKSIVSFILMTLMSMIFITETMGKFKHLFPGFHNVFVVQNIEMLIEILLFLLVYFFSLSSSVLRKVLFVMLLVFIIVAIVSVILWQPLDRVFPTYALVTGGLFILVAIQLYFYEGIKNMQHQGFNRSYMFYISIGLFIFYANEIPVMTLFNYFLTNNTSIDKILFIFNLKLIVSTLFYCLYSFGLLWRTKK